MAMSGARIAAGTSHHGWPRAAKAISAPARRTRPSRMSHRRGAPVTTPSAAETVPCPGGGAAIRPAPRGLARARRSSPTGPGPGRGWGRRGRCRSETLMVFPLAGVVGEYVDAGVAFGDVDHAAAVDEDVCGVVGDGGGGGGAAGGGVGGGEVSGEGGVGGRGYVVHVRP